MKIICTNCKNDIPTTVIPNFAKEVRCPHCNKPVEYKGNFTAIFKALQYFFVVLGLLGFCYGAKYVLDTYAITSQILSFLVYAAAFIIFVVIITAVMSVVYKIMLKIYGM